MAKAIVTMPTGATVIVQGSEEEVRRIVRTLGANRKKEVAARKQGKSLPSARDAILELKEEGFFDQARGLADVKERLESQGMIYPLTSLSGIVLNLVRKRVLGRVKQNNRWCYVRR